MLKLTRVEENPILSPTDLPWENSLIYNTGAVMHEGQVHLLYRAQGTYDAVSRFGLAVSSDGIHFTRSSEPVYSGTNSLYDSLGVEDTRIVKVDDTYYLVYTAVSPDTEATINPDWAEKIAKVPKIALAMTKDFVKFETLGMLFPDTQGKNASLFPRKIRDEYWLIYRVGLGMTFISHSPSLTAWTEGEPVFDRRLGAWDCVRTGIGSPPIETEKGWLIFYHGVDDSGTYRLGIMFLDLENPAKIIYRSPYPIFEPEKDYEMVGLVPKVVFTCGAIERDGQYFVYYGAADHVVGLATVEKKAVLNLF